MNTTFVKVGLLVLSFVVIFTLGFLLSRSGKPYNLIVFTIHKLVSVGVFGFMGVTVYKTQRINPLDSAQVWMVVVTAIIFVAAIVTGGLLSSDLALPKIVQKLHHILPYLVLLSNAILFISLG